MEINWVADLIIELPEGTDKDAFLEGLEDRINAYIERRGGKALGTFALVEIEDGEEQHDQEG